MAPNTVWALALLFGMLPNAAYSIYLLLRKGTWRNFCRSCSPQFRASVPDGGASSAEAARKLFVLDVCNYALAALMGVFWFTANICYSVGAEMLGEQGPVLGWAIFICGMILVANVAGFLLKEWQGVETWTIIVQLAGLALVCSAIVCLSLAGLYAKAD
jgi:L-rhamnose-H+ transport protein